MSKKKTNIEFINEATLVHNHTFDYSKSNYINNRTPINIICKIHGEFWQNPTDHLNGHGCSKCAGKNKITQEEFILKAKQIHKKEDGLPKYDYSLTVYKNNKTKVKIICPEHGIFQQKAEHHINTKTGCPKCAGVGKITQKEFEFRAKSIHHNEINEPKYLYDKTKFINAHTKVTITCPTHGEFIQTANMHLRGNGCPKCKISKGEEIIFNFLVQNKVKFTQQKKFIDCINKLPLPFDFYLPNFNICIEYDGALHYKKSNFRNGEQKLLTIQKNDKIKNKFCLENNITLIRIPYWEINKIKQILTDKLPSISNSHQCANQETKE